MNGVRIRQIKLKLIRLKQENGSTDLRGEFLGEQAMAPRVGGTGTGVDRGLQFTRQLIASRGTKQR